MKNTTLKICIILSVLIIISLIGFFVILNITKSKVIDVAHLNNLVAEKALYATQNHSLNALVDDVAPNMLVLSSRVASSTAAVSYLESLESLAKQSNLTVLVNSINTADADASLGTQYQWLQISLSTQGSWQSTNQFLALLQSLPYKITLGDIILNHTSAVITTGQGSNQKKVSQEVWAATFIVNTLQQK